MRFTPIPLPKFPVIQRTFQRVAEAFKTIHDYDVLEALPDKPREGMTRYFAADVVSGGSTKGLYCYDGSAWNKLW
jgi:hypothetical protein